MMFGFMATVAEDESRSISDNTRWAMQKKVEQGEYKIGNHVLGYSTVDGKLIPDKDSDTVRTVFEMYRDGEKVATISRYMYDHGVTARNGGRMSSRSVKYILANEVYRGDRQLQKQAPRDYLTKKPMKGEYKSNYLENDHEAIVDTETWTAVQERLEYEKNHRRRSGGKPHPLHGKLFCGCCGRPMTRRSYRGSGGGYKAWECSDRYKGGDCKGRIVREDEILKAIGENTVQRVDVMEAGLKVS